MCNSNKNCLKRTPTAPEQGVHCRRCPFQKGAHFREREFTGNKVKMKKKNKRSRGWKQKHSSYQKPTQPKLFGMSIKAGNIKLKKKLSDASMSTGERVTQIFNEFFSRSLTLHQSSM